MNEEYKRVTEFIILFFIALLLIAIVENLIPPVH
jgi:predicted nucleic acid-binding Zn ribbon protein